MEQNFASFNIMSGRKLTALSLQNHNIINTWKLTWVDQFLTRLKIVQLRRPRDEEYPVVFYIHKILGRDHAFINQRNSPRIQFPG